MNGMKDQLPSLGYISGSNSISVWSPLKKSTTMLAGFFSVAGLIYLALLGVHLWFPGIQAGADQIYNAKNDYVRHNPLFRKTANCRVLVCGTSKVLSGFQPLLFDHLAGSNVSSFNLGLPGSDAFIWEQETLVARGETPTHVVLTQSWGTNDIHDLDVVLKNDAQLMQRLFPFRKLLRELVLFELRSLKHGGLRAYYRRVVGLVEQMKHDQGYHFIESQSHYPGHRLPDGFHSEGDDPSHVKERLLLAEGPVFERLRRIADQGGFKVIMAPGYYREGEVSPVEPDLAKRQRLALAGIQLCGPDYWVFPPRYFSDPVHLNPEGAREYTERLWRLLEPVLKETSPLPARRDG